MSVAGKLVRTAFGKNDAKRDAGLWDPEDVECFSDLNYAGGENCGGTEGDIWHLLDVYRPKWRGGRLPVIINVHGGGWVYGTKKVYRYYGMSLAQRGFAFVNFNYRLAPEHRFPAQLEDIDMAVKWALGHGDEYGFDTENIFMAGDSAGAHLLTLYSCACTNPSCAKALSLTPSFAPKAVALNCGAYDITGLMKTNGLQMKGLMKDLLGKRRFSEKLERINAVRYLTKDFPPAFIMSCNGDFLRGQADVMANRLATLGAAHCLKIYGADDNVLQHVFHCNVKLPDAKICNDEECSFFRKQICSLHNSPV